MIIIEHQLLNTSLIINKEEKKLYDKSLEGIIPKNQIIIGVHKIGAQRNFIEQYYKKNTLLIMIDDDIYIDQY